MRRFAVVSSGLFACLAACGDDGARRIADAPPASDGPLADAPPPAMVNVTTLARSYETVPARTPHPGALVFAVGPTGGLVGTATTAADGTASVPLPEGGSVTVVYPPVSSGDPNTVVTYAGVKPGDSLTFGDYATSYAATTGQTGTMTISWAAVTNAVRYRLYSPCTSSYSIAGTTATINLAPSCQADTAPIGLVAYDASDNVLASVFLPAATYTPNTALDIAAGQWVAQTAAANYTITLTNVDAAANTVNFAGYDEFAFGEYGSFFLSYPPIMYGGAPNAGTATQAVSLVASAPRHSAAARLQHATHAGLLWFFKAGASPVTIDAGTIPWVDTLTVDSQARTLAWTQTSGSYDAAALRFSWSNFNWTVILPPGVTQLDASTAPAELAPYLPTAADGLTLNGCELVDSASTASYDAVRALPEWRVTTTESAVRLGDEPAATLADCGEGYHF